MVGVAAQPLQYVPLVMAAGVDVYAAEDAVAERLVEGLGALEGAPARLERVEVDLAGGLWGAECPDEGPGDEAEREQEVPSDSRLDFVAFLRRHVWHFVVFSAEPLEYLASGRCCCCCYFLRSSGGPAVAVVSVLGEMAEKMTGVAARWDNGRTRTILDRADESRD